MTRAAKLADLEYRLRYERAEGLHTYHDCKCKRMWARGERCERCLLDAIGELTGRRPGNSSRRAS